MTVATYLWWMAALALALPFLDLLQRTFGGRWVERATLERALLGGVELTAVIVWAVNRGRLPLLPEPDTAVALAGSVLALTGALLAAWAKTTLGTLFSPHLGLQQGHRLVTTGPYALVRHPIYLGAVDFVLGSALHFNDAGLLLLAAVLTVCFWLQLRIEERIFARHLGAEYEQYRQRTPALFPLFRRRRGP